MRWTQALIPTQKETPADAQIASHQLLLRAGMIRQLGAGTYDFLPLGLRSLLKATQIVREEMNAAGASEVLLPALQPIELWQQSGRDAIYGDNLFRLKDRHGRQLTLGPTHEEVITEMVRAYVNSYKQLPLTLYQIQTKFRDEPRPRFGLLRVREFLMKDAYSFDMDLEGLNHSYDRMYAAYEKIFRRSGIPFMIVEAESGPIGGSASHEFTVPCDAGEDMIVTSDKGNYAANVERAEIGERKWNFASEPKGELTRVHTPGLPGIDDVGVFMKVKPKNMLKTLVFSVPQAPSSDRPENLAHPKWVVAVVRGDHDVNEAKLTRVAREQFNVSSISLVDTPEVRAKWPIGFVGPDAAIRDPQTVVVVDPDAAVGDAFWATGGNEIDYHVKYFNWFRECGDKLADPKKVAVADIRNAAEGDPSPKNDGGKLKVSRGIEIGHVFKLGTRYSESFDAKFLDDKGEQRPFIMGCYGIGVGRILIAAVETLHDDKGIIWPPSIAPFQAVVTPIKYDGEVQTVSDRLYNELNKAGIDTILDDRDARPGFKFADADLIGFPIRINVGDRGLKEGKVELKSRKAKDAEMVAVDEVISRAECSRRLEFMNLILIKHAAPDVLPEVSAEQWNLSERGRASCKALAESLRTHSPSVLISSKEPKAQETTELVAGELGVPWQEAADLHEHDRHGVPHMRSGEFISHIELMLRRPDERILGRESADEALLRFESGVQAVLAAHPDSNVGVVSHGTVIALFVAAHSQHGAFEMWRRLGLPSFVVMSIPNLQVQQIVERVNS